MTGGYPPFDATDADLLRAGRAAFPGFRLELVARTPSTQELAMRAAHAGAGAGWCAVAEEQTAGRGRQARTWSAPARTALLTSLLVPDAGPGGWAALAAGLAVAEAVDATVGVGRLDLGLKWPNDVLVRGEGGGKIAGVLIERVAGGAEPEPALVLGIGINVRVDEFPLDARGASLHRLLHPEEPPRREALLAALLIAAARWWSVLAAADHAAVSAAWQQRALGLNEPVVADTPSGRLEGVARGLDTDGGLLVETARGTVRLVAGDVHLVAEAGRGPAG